MKKIRPTLSSLVLLVLLMLSAYINHQSHAQKDDNFSIWNYLMAAK